MAKVKGPLQSVRARGRFAKILDFRDYTMGPMHESRVYIQPGRKKPSGRAQAEKELNITTASALWRALTQSEKDSWAAMAIDNTKYGAEYVWRPELSNYHKFMSYNLKRLSLGLPIVNYFSPLDLSLFPSIGISLSYAMPGLAFELTPPDRLSIILSEIAAPFISVLLTPPISLRKALPVITLAPVFLDTIVIPPSFAGSSLSGFDFTVFLSRLFFHVPDFSGSGFAPYGLELFLADESVFDVPIEGSGPAFPLSQATSFICEPRSGSIITEGVPMAASSFSLSVELPPVFEILKLLHGILPALTLSVTSTHEPRSCKKSLSGFMAGLSLEVKVS